MTTDRVSLRLLDWDTAFFGRRIAVLSAPPLDDDDLARSIREAKTLGVECVYALSGVEGQAAIQALSRAGARLVDVRITFERGLVDLGATLPDSAIRAAEPRDLAELRALAAASHESSRFYADQRFPRDLCHELFATWIEKSCGGWAQVVRVAIVDGAVRGYATGHVRENGRGEIGLVAVDPRSQGRGLGRLLVQATLGALRDFGLSNATVVTQGRNIGAQRLYQADGFRTQRVQTWHHLWIDEVRT